MKKTWHQQTALKIVDQLDDREAAALIRILNEVMEARNKYPDWPKTPISGAAIIAKESGAVMREAFRVEREELGGLLSKVRDKATATAVVSFRYLTEGPIA